MVVSPAFENVGLVLGSGGFVLIVLAVLFMRFRSRALHLLETRRFDDKVGNSLEQRYVMDPSFRDLYNAVHMFVNHPAFMVAGMAGASIIAILVGYWWALHTDISLSFIVLVLFLGFVWYIGDPIEATFVISFAERSALRSSDREIVTYYGDLLRLGTYFFMALGSCFLAAASFVIGGVLASDSSALVLQVLVLFLCVALSLPWRNTLKKLGPNHTRMTAPAHTPLVR